MLNIGTIITAALAWLALLFAVALLAERRPGLFAGKWRHIYALSLAVHCTSWAFYGTVAQAARHGWAVPPTFVGAIAMYVLGIAFLGKLVRLAREQHSTSLADFIATRLGRDAWLAAVVTLVAALGLIPYIALQLQAITMSFSTLTQGASHAAVSAPPLWRDGALYLALAMALFTMLFGTRRASVAEHNRALVLAIAFESVFKLLAFLAVGALVWWGLDGTLPMPMPPSAPPAVSAAGDFIPLALLGAMTIFIMPHQFHISVVECRDAADLRTARWQFPLYLLLISLPTLPLALVGTALLGERVPADMYVLAIPLALGQPGAALLGFLGGLSAATGMVIVSTLTLSLMIGNHWFAPGLLRGAWSRGHKADHRAELLRLRRVGIALVMLLGWAYSRMVSGNAALAEIGAVSFSALATLVPAMVFALWFPHTPPHAVLGGVLAAFAMWLWAMLLPTLADGSAWLPDGRAMPSGLHWLAPDELFGLGGWSRLGRAVVASLFTGAGVTVLLAGWRGRAQHVPMPGANARTLHRAGRKFLPVQQVDALLQGAPARGAVPADIAQRLEHELSAVLGSASARLLLDAARRQAGPDLDTVAAIVRETSEDVRFNQRLLQAALENMSQGISVVDAQLHLVAWNRRYAQLFAYPPQLLRIGLPVAALIRHNLERGLIGTVAVESEIARRLDHMRAGTPYLSERRFPDGSVVEIRGNPMPGGGFVATFTDVTGFREAEAALKRNNETLEQRVADRTERLEHARCEAERANAAKSRFLAAIGHDLLQPLHAAQLFADALQQQRVDAALLEPLRGALGSTHELLSSLLDISRLDAGGLVPEPRPLPLLEVLEPLASEFTALAHARGLSFHYRPTRLWVQTDPTLLRRVVQNFLANAIRYTTHGGIVLGVRRAGERLRIEVHDTGPGIAPEQQQRIFEEFRRGEDAPGQGLGLGLSIAERIAALLDAPLTLRSTPGRGTVFAVSLPRACVQPVPESPMPSSGLPGHAILVVDNDPQALAALVSLLHGWGHTVIPAASEDSAIHALETATASVWLLDYHLDNGLTGVALHARLCERFGETPGLILSADHSPAVRQDVLEHGLTLLPKPLRPLALKSVLERWLVGMQG